MSGCHRERLCELAVWRISPPVVVPTPAFDFVVGADSARMAYADGHCGEVTAWRISLPALVAAPAFDFVVGVDGTRME